MKTVYKSGVNEAGNGFRATLYEYALQTARGQTVENILGIEARRTALKPHHIGAIR
jgi:hypothetical protein